MARMNSRYPGSCSICGKRFAAGADIDYDRTTRDAAHWKCKQEEKPIPAGTPTFNIGGGSGYGYTGWHQGEVVHANKRNLEMGYPEYLFVLRAQSRYVREDGLSFGVGDDSGYLYSAVCREATAEEAAPVIAARRKREIEKQAKARLEEIKRQIRDTGEWPQPSPEEHSFVLEGERYFDTQDIYGGGDWFVVTDEHIWHCQNNGSDGGDWSRNNVRTGGAGAIGRRVPRTAELVGQLNALRELLGTTLQDEARERELLAMIESDRHIREDA